MITINPITDKEIGTVEVSRGWSEIFAPLLERYDLDYHGFPNRPTGNVYTTETKKFIIRPGYDWDCSCGGEGEDGMGCVHDDKCDMIQPNFLYKPTGFKLWYYKYPMRSATMLPGITTEQFMEIILDCMKG